MRHTTNEHLPGLVLGVSLVGSIGSMMGVYYTSPENSVQKHLFWLVSIAYSHSQNKFKNKFHYRLSTLAKPQHLVRSFSSARPYCLEPHCIHAALLARFLTLEPLQRRSFGFCYTLYHLDMVYSNDKYLYMGGPLLAGVTVVALTSLAPMAIPLGTRALAITESISLYGGLAVFGGFVLYEYVKYFPYLRTEFISFLGFQYAKNPPSCSLS
jgi:hypothetical protein